MNNQQFKNEWEAPKHKSIDEVFNRAGLNANEKETEYWLLRSKLQYSSEMNSNNFIKQISHVLIDLQSSRISGKKKKLVKEMFSGNVHKFEESKYGIRSKKNTSNKIESMFFELRILSFLMKNTNWEFVLPDDNIGKIPEYTALTELGNINIEAKLLNVDSIMDNIFGDDFTEDIFNRKEIDKEKGYIRIKEQVRRNYENAIDKYKNIDLNEYFLIFMEGYYKFEFMGIPVRAYLSEIMQEWLNDIYDRVVGLAFVDHEKTIFLKNNKCDAKIRNSLKPWLLEFHNYIP